MKLALQNGPDLVARMDEEDLAIFLGALPRIS
jgi:hypothetical protein